VATMSGTCRNCDDEFVRFFGPSQDGLMTGSQTEPHEKPIGSDYRGCGSGQFSTQSNIVPF
jgi:hypothetical protein